MSRKDAKAQRFGVGDIRCLGRSNSCVFTSVLSPWFSLYLAKSTDPWTAAADGPPRTTFLELSRSDSQLLPTPNLCAFASLRDIFSLVPSL
jgi:hypothetical protein